MTRTLAISDTGLRLIKAFEGFRPDDRTLVTGIRVVGYGHRLGPDDDPMNMSRIEAEEQLLDDLEPIEILVSEEVHAPLTQGQYDALCSLAFNIGIDAFRQSEIVQALNNGRVLDAANGFDLWRKATVNGHTYVVDALMRRRTAEKSLFLRNEPAVPAPSAMLAPQRDDIMPSHIDTPTWTGPKTVAETVSKSGADADMQTDAVISDPGVIEAANLGPAESEIAFVPGSLTESLETDIEADSDHMPVFVDVSAPDLESDAAEPTTDNDAPVLLEDAANFASSDEAAAKADDLSVSTPLEDMFQLSVDEIVEPTEAVAETGPADDTAILSDDLSETNLVEPGEEKDTDMPSSRPSSIAEAADSLGSRLSALLDSEDMVETAELSSSAVEVDDALTVTSDETTRSNLVSFPNRERVMTEPIIEVLDEAAIPDKAAIQGEGVEPEQITERGSDPKHDGLVLIDNLAADDVIRASRDPDKDAIFDPDGDPVENAMRYLERQAAKAPEEKKNGGFWIPMAIGALLVGASAVMLARGATELLSSWGPTAVVAAAITGGLMLVFAIYAFARGRLA